MSQSLEERAKKATVQRNADGDATGVLVAVSADELEALGVDPEETETVRFAVEDGEARFW